MSDAQETSRVARAINATCICHKKALTSMLQQKEEEAKT
jgi:hypothetical protein